MNFDRAWQYLKDHQPLQLKTSGPSGGTPFEALVSDSSICYKSSKDQKRYQSKENFRIYFERWFIQKLRDRSNFRNLTGKKSESARCRYFYAVFLYLEKIPELR
jgi:hypothetical protein